jgi:NAD-dependent dihydropyrimidine dehydrogenase PreA subunit
MATHLAGNRPLPGLDGHLHPPGLRFKVVDQLITNFHLPRSSLIIMVSTLAGRRQIIDAYTHAVSRVSAFSPTATPCSSADPASPKHFSPSSPVEVFHAKQSRVPGGPLQGLPALHRGLPDRHHPAIKPVQSEGVQGGRDHPEMMAECKGCAFCAMMCPDYAINVYTTKSAKGGEK